MCFEAHDRNKVSFITDDICQEDVIEQNAEEDGGEELSEEYSSHFSWSTIASEASGKIHQECSLSSGSNSRTDDGYDDSIDSTTDDINIENGSCSNFSISSIGEDLFS